MIKKSALRRIVMASLALIITLIIYLFPAKNDNPINVNNNLIKKSSGDVIYLLDNNYYVARTNIVILSKDVINKCKEIIETLTINSSKKEIIPNGFQPIIPKNTKINSISLKDGLLKVDFSKEFLSINAELESKMIESIIYSLTTLEEVENILIFVDGDLLTKLKDGNNVPNPLNRSFGINKVYDISSIKDTTKLTIYYISKYNDYYYYVPVTKVTNSPGDKIEIIIDELKSSPIKETNLMSFLASSAELLNYELLEEKINLSFNEYLLDDLNEKNILEEVKYAISLSVMDNFLVNEINFYIRDEKVLNVSSKDL